MALINLELEEHEILVFSAAANHVKGIESVGGKLFITNKRVAFRSHVFNIQTHVESFYFPEIREVTFANTLGIVPNGLRIFINGKEKPEKFVVNKRKEAKQLIDEQIN